MENIVIIGNGVSGVAAARHIRKMSNHKITIISAETDHHYSRTALMYIYMGHMKYEHTKPYPDNFWSKNNIELKRAFVEVVQTDLNQIVFDDGSFMQYDRLIIATGSKPNKFGWPGQDLNGVQGLYSMQDLETMEERSKDLKRAVIVGGGLIGLEMAEMFLSRNIPVTFLVREKSYWGSVLPKGEAELITRHIQEHHIDLRLETELDEVLDDGQGNVRGIRTKSGEEIECGFVGLTVGVHPNVEFLRSSSIEIDKGVLVDAFLETNVKNVYAIGDCAQHRVPVEGRRPVEQVWYTGKIMGETLANTICKGVPYKYQPGLWFNSAKFIDIEYQTYGWVFPKNKEDERSLYWEHADGKKCIHIVYNEKEGNVVGVNTFGIRHRHQAWEYWIVNRTSIEDVLQDLGAANFDPEFFTQYEKDVVTMYNEQTGKSLQLKKKRGLRHLLNVLKK